MLSGDTAGYGMFSENSFSGSLQNPADKELLRRQPVKDSLPKQMSPGGFQKGQPFGAGSSKRMEQVELFVVFDVNHRGSE